MRNRNKPKNGTSNFGAPQCMHMKFNGEQCLQPAMRHKKFCHFHNFLHECATTPGDGRLRIPIAEDTPSIQIGINQIMRAIISNEIDQKSAWMLLYGMQMSTSNLAKQRDVFPPPPPEPEEEEEPPSLAKLLLEKLREDSPSSFTEEENERIFHIPRSEPEGYPEIPPPIDMLPKIKSEKEHPKPNT